MKLKNLTFSNQNWNKKNKNPEKSENPKNNSENPKILKSFQKIIPKNPKNLSFFDIFFTYSGGSSVPLGTIFNSSRTNPRFGPSFK